MGNRECVEFLQWALPRMGLRWTGFRRVRRQVCKRIARRLAELGLEDAPAYQRYLSDHTEEWQVLDGLCRITISRFYRDRQVFDALATQVLPRLARQAEAAGLGSVRVWSAGCGAGEEPYSLSLLKHGLDEPILDLVPVQVLASDADAHQLSRARAAIYPASSLRELSPELLKHAFELMDAETYRLRRRYRQGVEFRQQDLRHERPAGRFQLILCRNVAFTYFETQIQERILADLMARLRAGGYLVIGTHERLPGRRQPLPFLRGSSCIYGPKPDPHSGSG